MPPRALTAARDRRIHEAMAEDDRAIGAERAARRAFGLLTERRLALVLLFVAPALFASNMLVARATHDAA